MTTDYEVEYDNRARVPEHPEVFVRWAREGAAYRAGAHNAKLGISYGPSMRRTIDLFPASGDDQAPFAMFIHGGWWRSLDPSMFSQMAAGPNARGVSVAIAGEDLCPHASIADSIAQMRSACLMLWRKRRQRMVAEPFVISRRHVEISGSEQRRRHCQQGRHDAPRARRVKPQKREAPLVQLRADDLGHQEA